MYAARRLGSFNVPNVDSFVSGQTQLSDKRRAVQQFYLSGVDSVETQALGLDHWTRWDHSSCSSSLDLILRWTRHLDGLPLVDGYWKRTESGQDVVTWVEPRWRNLIGIPAAAVLKCFQLLIQLLKFLVADPCDEKAKLAHVSICAARPGKAGKPNQAIPRNASSI